MLALVPDGADLRGEAEEALRLARGDPAAVRAKAAVPGWLPLSADPETAGIAELALGVALTELHELGEARRRLEGARDRFAGAGVQDRLVEAHTNLALLFLTTGEFDAAQAELKQSSGPVPKGAAAARVECQRALAYQRLGRPDDALESYRRGLAAFRRAGDRQWEARALSNRALLHAYGGRYEAAKADLRRSARIFEQLGLRLQAAHVLHNAGFVAARQGDIPAALMAYERAARGMADLDAAHPAALLDYCETLLRANLVGEAEQVGRDAVDRLERAGMETDLAEARLLLAEVVLAKGDLDDAERLAVLAQQAFVDQGRGPWAVKARYLWLRVRWERGDRSEDTRQAAQALASDLGRAGWAGPAAHARIVAARIALERGEFGMADAELRSEARHGSGTPAEIRIQAWHAEALLRWRLGNARGAQSALRAGMRTLSAYRASLGATELRVNAGNGAYELGRLAMKIAVEGGEPGGVLTWAERSRACTVWLSPVRPPADDELARRLAQLRALDKELDEAAVGGQDTGAMLRRKAALEDIVRQKSWHASGFRAAGPAPPPLGTLRRALGGRVLVEFVESEGLLYAVTLRDRRSRLVCLGPAADVEREADGLRFTLNRIAAGRGVRGWEEAMRDVFAQSADRLDALLFQPLRSTIGERPLVIVPTGALHLLPWPALPACRGRALSVVPSAALWLQAASRPRVDDAPIVLAAGPGVSHAAEELRALAGIYPAARTLGGGSATARKVAAAMDGAGLAHVIAHGSFRADNPLFSSLRMADGPLTVYELERLAAAPQRVVLSACNAGLAEVRPDNELLGLSAALFALGTTTLIASVLLVGDSQTGRMMIDFHRALAAGVDAPAALAAAQLKAGECGLRALASAASFVCFGA